MSSIDKRERNGKITWRVRYRDPSGAQRNKSFPRKVDAERFVTETDAAKLTGSFVDPAMSKTTFSDAADTWLAGKVNIKPSTMARYESALKVHVLPRWGRVPLSRIDHPQVQSWVADLVHNGQSGASVRKVYNVLSGVLARAVRDRRIATNPAAGIELPRAVRRRRHRYLTADQVSSLAAAASELPDDRPRRTTDEHVAENRLVILALAYCGLRWGEMAALRVKRVDLMKRRLVVAEALSEVNGGKLIWGTPKTHESRWVPVPSFLVDALMVHIAGKNPDDLVFTAPLGGPLRNRAARRDWFDRAATAIGETGLTPHELRHTAASLAVSAGANVKAVQRMLGHSSAAMTLDIYTDLFDSDLDAVAERLDVLVRAAEEARVSPTCPKLVAIQSDRRA